MKHLNETHDPSLNSWVPSAQDPASDFPLQNLPFARFRPKAGGSGYRIGVAIGDQILDMSVCSAVLGVSGVAAEAAAACTQTSLNALMALSPSHWSALRLALSRALRAGSPAQAVLQRQLVPQDAVDYGVAANIGDYTDFYTSIHHATNIGRLFRPDNPLLPNYKWIPIGYHGRTSSIGISGQHIQRPLGQLQTPGTEAPALGHTRRLDFELELGAFIGQGNPSGRPIQMDNTWDHIFGMCLLNDWSARDIQSWEYQPLGPFLSKNFATTLSPWVVTTEALAPYRCEHTRPAADPQPLPYLDSPGNRTAGALDIQLEVTLQTALMRSQGIPPQRLCLTNYRHAYWTLSQMVAHHTINGCNLQPGDLLGTGTLSGPTATEAGALIEITQGGRAPITVATGETRTFLEDGDEVEIRGWCAGVGARRIGLGRCSGRIAVNTPPA